MFSESNICHRYYYTFAFLYVECVLPAEDGLGYELVAGVQGSREGGANSNRSRLVSPTEQASTHVINFEKIYRNSGAGSQPAIWWMGLIILCRIQQIMSLK